MEGQQLSGWVWVGWWGKSGKLGKHVKIGWAYCRAHTMSTREVTQTNCMFYNHMLSYLCFFACVIRVKIICFRLSRTLGVLSGLHIALSP